MDDILIAAVCHEANRMYCLTLGDTSQVSWMEAPTWQRESAISGVQFRRANPSTSSAEMHAQWLARKCDEGWKYGLVKDAEQKVHPCYLPYDDLPDEEKRKDRLFSAIYDALAPEPVVGGTGS